MVLKALRRLWRSEAPTKPAEVSSQSAASYDVAISYASEDTELADVIADRLRQDGYRCFYNPNRLHKLLGLQLSPALQAIYGAPQTRVVALISEDYKTKRYPQEEFAAALSGGVDRIIPVLIGGADAPQALGDRSYATSDGVEPATLAIQISQALESAGAARPTAITTPAAVSEQGPAEVVRLDNPRFPYGLDEVAFHDSGERYVVDISGETLEFEDPRGFIDRGLGLLPEDHPFAAVTREQVFEAKRAVRALIEERAANGWEVFNGPKFGVKQVLRRRAAGTERHALVFLVYETDYFTHLFARKLYGLLTPDRSFRAEADKSFSEYSGLLTSIGLNLLVFAPQEKRPHLILSKRSGNVANATGAGLWHVSVNEGVSLSDRYAREFDASSTFFRGLDEELNLPRGAVERAELFEPFLEYRNFEIGVTGAAYTATPAPQVIDAAERAGDRMLETERFHATPATTEALTRLLRDPETQKTSALSFCLGAVLGRDLLAP